MSLKVNIIGLGIMGKNVGRSLLRNPNVSITACADLKQDNIDEAKAELKFDNSYTDFREMIAREKPDAVYIATPDWAHFEPVMTCLDAGIHVHVEKPLTTDETEAANIVRKVKETGLKLQVSYNHRWLAPYNATWNMIRDGQIGECIMGYARKNNPISVPTKMLPWSQNSSPMWFLSGHDIDLMTWWFNDDPVEVKGYGIKKVLKEKMGWDTYRCHAGAGQVLTGCFCDIRIDMGLPRIASGHARLFHGSSWRARTCASRPEDRSNRNVHTGRFQVAALTVKL